MASPELSPNVADSYRLGHLEYERVYLTLCEVADTPFHIQGDVLYLQFTPYTAKHDYSRF